MALPTVFTLGHSNRSFETLVALLRAHGVEGVADVRRHPFSRRHPQFDSPVLAAALAREDLAYAHLPALGGMREAREGSPHVALAPDGFRGYADYMESPAFEAGVADLLALAAARPTAALCAEALPNECHRSLLSDALLVRGVRVVHLLDEQRRLEHALSPLARRDGHRLVYAGAQETLGF